MKSVDEPESPSFSPDGRTIAFSALRGGIGDIFTVDLETQRGHQPHQRRLRRLRADLLARRQVHRLQRARQRQPEAVPARSRHEEEDAAHLRHARRDRGAVPRRPHARVLVDGHRSRPCRSSRRSRKNGNIYNIWTLDLKNGELRQYTDALGGNFSPVVLQRRRARTAIAFVSYYKGDYGIHTLERKEPLHTAATRRLRRAGADHRLPGAAQHTLVAENKREEGHVREDVPRGPAAGERRRHEQRRRLRRHGRSPSATCSATSSSTSSPRRSRSTGRCRSSYVNLSRRFQFALQGYSQTQFFYGQLERRLLRPVARAVHQPRRRASRRAPSAAARAFGIYPFNRYRRLELSGGVVQLERAVQRPAPAGRRRRSYQQQQFGQQVFRNGTLVPLGVAFVQETTVFREFGPLAGSTMRLAYDVAPKIGNTLSRQTLDVDARYYLRLGSTGVLALRVRGFKSMRRRRPTSSTSAATPRCAATTTCSSSGRTSSFANAELRFPLIEAALTPIGVLGGIRGVFFANIGGGWFNDQDFKFCDAATRETFTTDRRLPARTPPASRSSTRSDRRGLPMSDLRRRPDRQRVPPAGRPRVVRPRPRDLRARLPDPLRLVVADAVQQGLGGRRSSPAQTAAAASSASRASRSGSATTSNSTSLHCAGLEHCARHGYAALGSACARCRSPRRARRA